MSMFRAWGAQDTADKAAAGETTSLFRHLQLWLALPVFIVGWVLITSKHARGHPSWDTGYLDHVDREMFRKALAATPLSAGRSTPKIAFMFLVRGPLPMEEMWERFFKGHEGQFSIYMHASTPGFDCDSSLNTTTFKGKQIPSVPITWGGPNMVRAERRLLASALLDPANERFVLLSESCVPIHNYTYVYDYFFAANVSYITSHQTAWRYKPKMAPLIHKEQFMKGSQWLTLIRDHAIMVVNDTRFYDKIIATGSLVPDESYIQTMIPMLDPARVMMRGVEYVHWRYITSRHPMTYTKEDVTLELIRSIQESTRPPVEIVGFLQLRHHPQCKLNGRPHPCFLFARKFAPDAVDSMRTMGQALGY